uniref:16S/18S rRNA aminocarboxypropyltransferase Tsr3 C-terminal domain-containing protein n=1 Tax=uncultured bacterium W5-77b TaxID=1131000 RepID=H9BWF8_9BACT|nr:hypothetical protein [uncultured bacterium W5-77b]
MSFPPTVVLRHRKENLKKCSLTGLEQRDDFRFFTYPQESPHSLDGYIVLKVDAPPLAESDAERGLFVLDATWRYAHRMYKNIALPDDVVYRSLPSHFLTAYPRRQDDCLEPGKGLASVEAIFLAYFLLGRNPQGLLDNYYWREPFLEKNQHYLGVT